MIIYSFAMVNKQLKNDWEKIRTEFMKLPIFEDAIELYSEDSTINSTGYSLVIQNSYYLINWESDFGKKAVKDSARL